MSDATRDARRRFNTVGERFALFSASDGRCSICAAELSSDWQADHVTPWSAGGPTDVVNGQALCPDCNRSKGDRIDGIVNLSAWQSSALDRYQSKAGDFLLVACPGAGKTRFAVAAAMDDLSRGYRNVVVVVPTSHLRRQWADAASEFGLQLDPTFANKSCTYDTKSFDGIVVTYHSVAESPYVYRNLFDNKTLVVLDEIHHAGDPSHSTWGSQLTSAFQGSGRRLLLSGTPNRTDRNPIPFVVYDEDGNFVDDYTYGYGEAIQDYREDATGRRYPVVRPVEFITLNGTGRWRTASQAHVEIAVDLKDATDDDMSKALRSSLDPSSQWISDTLERADRALSTKRQRMSDAGGLVIAADQDKARKYGQILERITGEQVPVAVSDQADASQIIADFTKSSERWIVAVQMISEGVDIPRLAVAVYGTVVRTELFFRQAVGRVIRSRGYDDVTSAVMFIPWVEPLVKFASDIEVITKTALRLKEEREERESESPAGPFEVTTLPGYGSDEYGLIRSGTAFSKDEIAWAEKAKTQFGFPPDTPLSTLVDFAKSVGMKAEPPSPAPERQVPIYEQVKHVKRDIDRVAGQLAARVYGHGSLKPDVNTDLLKAGFPNRQKATLEELHQILTHLEMCLAAGRRA